MSADDVSSFIRANTQACTPPLVPEIRLHLATDITPIWQATETELETQGLPPPYWAFCWPGGQALARYLLDRPETVAGRRVLDFATGGGVSAIAAAMAGAASVTANDIDGFALRAVQLNAALNGVAPEISPDDLVRFGGAEAFDVILAGDIFYERSPAIDIEAFLRNQAARGATVLVGDPGRKYLPRQGMTELARYDVPTSLELERLETSVTVVWRIDG